MIPNIGQNKWLTRQMQPTLKSGARLIATLGISQRELLETNIDWINQVLYRKNN